MPPLQYLRAVIFDWAGTVIDFGSQAPMGAFVRLFAQEGVSLSVEEARIPMGLPKWQHIEALGRLPRVAEAWRALKGSAMSSADVDRLYAIFTPMNAASIKEHAELIPGVADMVMELREAGLRIGSTTGYNRAIAEVMAELAAAQGYVPDNLVCAGDLPETRPSPLAVYRTLLDLQVWPAAAVVKVDDTLPGLLEGRHAGCWTVGVLDSGNEVGLSLDAWSDLTPAEQESRRQKAATRLLEAQPDYLLRTVAELPDILVQIDARMASGQRPPAQAWHNPIRL